jgi:PKD repeat protein
MKTTVVTTLVLCVTVCIGVDAAQGPASPERAAEQIAFTYAGPFTGGACADYCRGADISVLTDVDGTHVIPINIAPATRGAWSPDGTKFLTASGDIFVMPVVGGAGVNLTNHPATYSTPAWSPDGTRIAFASDRDGPWDLYVMNADGSHVVRVGTGVGMAWYPTWSPDNARLAFTCIVDSSSFAGNHDICAINADGSGFVRLTSEPEGDDAPDWSPDGATIAFSTGRYDYLPELAVMTRDGANVTRLTPGLPGDSPSWSSDGTRIVFVQNTPSDYGLPWWLTSLVATVNADGTGLTYLAVGWNASWRPWTGAPNNRPVASFTFGCSGHTCSFDGSGSSDSDGRVAAYGWLFDDGVASGAMVTHTFTSTHNVRLVIMDDGGALGTTAQSVNQPPVASFTTTCNRLTCTFDGSASYDPDGTIGVSWDFGDGGPVGRTLVMTHTYAVGGTYRVTLSLQDQDYATTTSIQSVMPADVPPAVTVTSPATGTLFTSPASVTITAAAIDPDGEIVRVDFYSGTTLIGTAALFPYSISFLISSPGSYTLTAVATDDGGHAAVPISVLPPPGASFTYACSGLACTFDASGSHGQLVRYAWTFGDGSTATGQTATHIYSSAGRYIVGLTVWDLNGVASATVQSVVVKRRG